MWRDFSEKIVIDSECYLPGFVGSIYTLFDAHGKSRSLLQVDRFSKAAFQAKYCFRSHLTLFIFNNMSDWD